MNLIEVKLSTLEINDFFHWVPNEKLQAIVINKHKGIVVWKRVHPEIQKKYYAPETSRVWIEKENEEN